MRAIRNTLAMAGVAGALIMSALAPAAAQTWGWNDPYYGGPHRGYYRHGGLIEAPVAGRAYVAPYSRSFGWRQCTTDEGYGRFTTCDHGGAL